MRVCVLACVRACVRACVSIYLSVCLTDCLSLASDSSETIEIIVINLGMVTDSDMVVRHVFIILTLTFIQGHIYLSHKNHTCSIISETVQAIRISFAAKIIQLKGYIICSQSEDLALRSRSKVRLKLDKCVTCTIIAISRTV